MVMSEDMSRFAEAEVKVAETVEEAAARKTREAAIYEAAGSTMMMTDSPAEEKAPVWPWIAGGAALAALAAPAVLYLKNRR